MLSNYVILVCRHCEASLRWKRQEMRPETCAICRQPEDWEEVPIWFYTKADRRLLKGLKISTGDDA